MFSCLALNKCLVCSGQLNVKNEELEAMIKEASGPINFTVFLTMFGEKLKGERPKVLPELTEEHSVMGCRNSLPAAHLFLPVTRR